MSPLRTEILATLLEILCDVFPHRTKILATLLVSINFCPPWHKSWLFRSVKLLLIELISFCKNDIHSYRLQDTNAITVDWRCWRAAGVLRAKGLNSIQSIARSIAGRAPDVITLYTRVAQKWLTGTVIEIY